MHEPVYYTTNAGMYCKRCGRTAIALSTATTSSEFKQCIQPIMDGHAPTMDNIQCRSIVLFHISPCMSPFITQQMPECTVKGVVAQPAQPQRHPNSKCASSPLWMAMHQQWIIISGSLWYYLQ